MKKRTKKLLLLAWLIILTAKVFDLDSRIDWLQNEQDNVIEVLLTGK